MDDDFFDEDAGSSEGGGGMSGSDFDSFDDLMGVSGVDVVTTTAPTAQAKPTGVLQHGVSVLSPAVSTPTVSKPTAPTASPQMPQSPQSPQMPSMPSAPMPYGPLAPPPMPSFDPYGPVPAMPPMPRPASPFPAFPAEPLVVPQVALREERPTLTASLLLLNVMAVGGGAWAGSKRGVTGAIAGGVMGASVTNLVRAALRRNDGSGEALPSATVGVIGAAIAGYVWVKHTKPPAGEFRKNSSSSSPRDEAWPYPPSDA